jgi:hypothetical protein
VEVSETQPIATTVPAPEQAPYDQCGQCGAPVEAKQRYCVVCGFHRRQVRDPVSRYMMRATSHARSGSPRRPGRSRRASSLGAAVLIASVPLAVGLGVLVGRSSNSGDAKLIAALRSQRPAVITAGGGGGASSATYAASLRSDFPLKSGYTVELQTLPTAGATNSTVTNAEHAAASKGAAKVGMILQSAFKVTPAPPSGTLVIYSGAYKAKGDATKALAKLSKAFPGARLVRVQAASSGTAGGGKVLAHTQYGVVHQIVGFHATKADLQQGAQVVKKIQQTQGKSYVDAQRNLPDQISVP